MQPGLGALISLRLPHIFGLRRLGVFGTAGVRGIFNVTQTPQQVYDLALNSTFTVGRGAYGVGWDGRKSSMLLGRAVTAGISAAGSETVSFGMVPTPVTAYGSKKHRCKISFSVTASHNPPEYSGVKLFNGKGMELPKEDEARIERVLVVEGRKDRACYGSITPSDVLEDYVSEMLARFGEARRRMKIVVDCANGPGALVTPRVLQQLGHDVIPLNAQISWRFPARLPEPTPQNLSEVASMVSALGAAFGMAHDGDADRLVLINSAGRVVADSLVSILALNALGLERGVIVLSENTSYAVEEEARNRGLRVVRSRIGKTFAEIERESACFATEPSKIVSPPWGMWEDGMFCAILIADAISRDKELLDLLSAEPRWHYKQVNVQVSVDLGILAARAEVEFARFKVVEVRSLDGLKLIFKDQSWIMFRSSGTELKVRIYCESKDAIRLQELLDVGNKVVHDSRVVREGDR